MLFSQNGHNALSTSHNPEWTQVYLLNHIFTGMPGTLSSNKHKSKKVCLQLYSLWWLLRHESSQSSKWTEQVWNTRICSLLCTSQYAHKRPWFATALYPGQLFAPVQGEMGVKCHWISDTVLIFYSTLHRYKWLHKVMENHTDNSDQF